MRWGVLTRVVFAAGFVVVAGCSQPGPSTAGPAATDATTTSASPISTTSTAEPATAPPTISSTTAPTTSSTVEEAEPVVDACGVHPAPGAEIEVIATPDLDGDGVADSIERWDTEEVWRNAYIRVVFADGSATGGLKTELSGNPFLSSIDLDGDDLQEIWLYPGGNTAHAAYLYQLSGCAIAPVVIEGDIEPPPLLWSANGNAGAYTRFGIWCEDDTVRSLELWPANWSWVEDGANAPTEFDWAVRSYRLADGSLTQVALEEGKTDSWQDASLGPLGFQCGGSYDFPIG